MEERSELEVGWRVDGEWGGKVNVLGCYEAVACMLVQAVGD